MRSVYIGQPDRDSKREYLAGLVKRTMHYHVLETEANEVKLRAMATLLALFTWIGETSVQHALGNRQLGMSIRTAGPPRKELPGVARLRLVSALGIARC